MLADVPEDGFCHLRAGPRKVCPSCGAGFFLAAMLLSSTAHAETVSVAVAANFTAAAEELAAAFEAETGHELILSFGATGGLYAQISQGAPFEVFLSADSKHPASAIEQGLAVAGTSFTYAVGALALYSATFDVSIGAVALDAGFIKLAIANPLSAPYGIAAVEALRRLGKYDGLAPKLVVGENVTQTLQFIDTGNAELGFVAASQIVGKDWQWVVPAELHAPIVQDAVLLTSGEKNPAARAFLEYLQGEAASTIIAAAGYTVP